jgi:branched-chain amino acid transport system substrate-binding protein
VRPARLSLVGAAAVLALTAGCGARFDRPTTSSQQFQQDPGLTPDQGGPPVTGTTGTALPGTTGGPAIGTSGVVGPSATGGTTAGTGGTATGGSTGGTTGPTTVPAGVTTGVTPTSIKVGLFVPKQGAAPVPPTVDAQVQNYFDYVKSKGGIFGRNVTVVIYDTKGTEAGARAAVQQAQTDKIFAALSLDRLGVAATLVTALHKAGIPHLVAQTSPTQQIPSDTFDLGPNHFEQGRQIARYFAHTLRNRQTGQPVKKVGVVSETDPTLYGPVDAFKQEANKLGLQVVHSERVNPDDSQFLQEAQKLSNDGAEVTWLYMAPNVAINIAKSSQSINYNPVWFANSISWQFNLALAPGAGAFDGAHAFAPWGGLSDPRYKTFNQVNTAGRTNADRDIGLAAWGFGQVFAAAVKGAGKDLGRTSFINAMSNLVLGTTDVVTGVPLCWSPLDFRGGEKYGGKNYQMVLKVQGSGANSVWATEANYRRTF